MDLERVKTGALRALPQKGEARIGNSAAGECIPPSPWLDKDFKEARVCGIMKNPAGVMLETGYF